MARNLILTSYTNQSFQEICHDLTEWKKDIQKELQNANNILKDMEKDKDWNNLYGDKFKNAVYESKTLLETAEHDISLVLKEMKKEVKEYHPKLLKRLGDEGARLNEKFGVAKHEKWKELSDIENKIYAELRDSVCNLVDLQCVAERLTDFVGLNKSIPWANIISNVIAFLALILSFIAIFK